MIFSAANSLPPLQLSLHLQMFCLDAELQKCES